MSSAYAGDALGTPVTWIDGSTHYVGYDAFGTIRAGVNSVIAGGTVNIAAGTYIGQVTVSQNMTIAGAASSTTFLEPPAGDAPALTVAGGNVTLSGVTATNDTGSPTILMSGGSLTVRNSVIDGSTVAGQAAISITGGTVDLGTSSLAGRQYDQHQCRG